MRKSNLTLRTPATVFDLGKHRAVIVEYSPENPHELVFRAAGCKRRYALTLDHLYNYAVRKAVEAERRQKKRKGRV